tara:strand:+ start:34 stop:1545 length:1512 start_codon:yes stop_codon:yes gene_type:complete
MALVLKDRVKETTTTTGTGTYTLAGAVTGFEAFSSVGDGNTTYYSCTDGTDFEVGIGTYTASGTTLARTTILQSSNSDSAVSWNSGTKTIFCAQPAEKAVFLNASNNIKLGDNEEIILGASDDLKIKHTGSRSVISDTGTGGLRLSASADLEIMNSAATETKAKFTTDGSVELYHDNVKKLETTSGGIDVTGTVTDDGATHDGDVTFTGDNYNIVFDKSDDALEFADNAKAKFGTDGDMEIYHNNADGVIDTNTGRLVYQAQGHLFRDHNGSETHAIFNDNGSVELYHDNSKKLETTADGVTLTDTDAGSSDGPVLALNRDSSSPADNDAIGTIHFKGDNDAGENLVYGEIQSTLQDASDGTEDGALQFQARKNGSLITYLELSGNSGRVNIKQDLFLFTGHTITFEGATSDANETTLTVADPTADRTITLPDATGTVLTTADSGIGNGNVATFTSGAADNDFLRIDGTSIEGRSASEVLSDIGATTAADAANEATALAIALG